MIVFMLLCGLGVGFYLVLLAALYKDGRRHRRQAVANPVHTVNLGTVFFFDSAAAEACRIEAPLQWEGSVVSFSPASVRPEHRRPLDSPAKANVVYLAAPNAGDHAPYCS